MSHILGRDGSCARNFDKDQFIRFVRGICHYGDLVPSFFSRGRISHKSRGVESRHCHFPLVWMDIALTTTKLHRKMAKGLIYARSWSSVKFAPQLVGQCGDLEARKNFVSACLKKLQYMGFLFAARFYLRVKRRVQRKYMI